MSSSRQFPSPAAAPVNDSHPHLPAEAPPLPTTGTVIGFDGSVLAEISRHVEHPVCSGQAPLIVVDVVGDVDADTAPLLHTALTQAIKHNRRVSCDLGRVAFLGAAGVNTILAALRGADDTGCVFTVRRVHGIGAVVFQITGLDAVLASRD